MWRLDRMRELGLMCGGAAVRPALAVDRDVCSQDLTIQAAIGAFSDGDTVIVADGTYSGN